MNISTLLISILLANLAHLSHQQSVDNMSQCSFLSNRDNGGAPLQLSVCPQQNSIVSTTGECCLLCQLNAQCRSWTFARKLNTNSGTCILKSNVGQIFSCPGSLYILFFCSNVFSHAIYITEFLQQFNYLESIE